MPLGSCGNVNNTCLIILKNKGFDITIDGDLNDDEYPTDALWIAEKDGFKFMADNPIELLGLVGIYEYKKPKEDIPYWWLIKEPDIWLEIMQKKFPDGESKGT